MQVWFARGKWPVIALIIGFGALFIVRPVMAAIPPPGPQNASAGLQGKVQTPPPSKAASIATPSAGQSFSKMPLTVNGLCSGDVLVKIFANNVFVGAALCQNGSYSVQISLFDGRNDLVARVFDALDQPGPDSNVVSVTYNNDQFALAGASLLSLTSAFAHKGANPGQQLAWPIVISGGNAPYALSVDWGDGTSQDLYSAQFAGTTDIKHTYQSAGVYIVIVKATDKGGQTAFLQLVGQANGAITQTPAKTASEASSDSAVVQVLWVPAALTVPLLFVAFWLGRKFELLSLRRRLERRN